MNDAFGGTVVDGRRKEETFQVGWRIWSQLRDGHSATRFGRATPQDSVLEDFWRLQENRAVPSAVIWMRLGAVGSKALISFNRHNAHGGGGFRVQ